MEEFWLGAILERFPGSSLCEVSSPAPAAEVEIARLACGLADQKGWVQVYLESDSKV